MAIVFHSPTKSNKSVLHSQLKYVSVAISNAMFNNMRLIQRDYSSHKDNYLKCYTTLGLSNNSDQDQVRQAFLSLVKRYHPDSGSPEANEEKFNQVETAYRKLQDKFASERWNVNEGSGEYGLYYKEKVKEFDIQHTAPQHRQYLSYDGYGYGTPQQRQKQFQKMRAFNAVQNVYNHRIAKLCQTEEQTLVVKEKHAINKIKIRSEIDRLVEDLIQESMSRGDFNNLAGSGKPLAHQYINPHVDFVTQKMNQMLLDNGFAPGWITLQKDIRRELRKLRSKLAEQRMLLGPTPLTSDEASQWTEAVAKMTDCTSQLNKKISDFNLQVPLLNNQMVLVRLEREANNILEKGKTKLDIVSQSKDAVRQVKQEENTNIFGFFEQLFGIVKT